MKRLKAILAILLGSLFIILSFSLPAKAEDNDYWEVTGSSGSLCSCKYNFTYRGYYCSCKTYKKYYKYNYVPSDSSKSQRVVCNCTGPCGSKVCTKTYYYQYMPETDQFHFLDIPSSITPGAQFELLLQAWDNDKSRAVADYMSGDRHIAGYGGICLVYIVEEDGTEIEYTEIAFDSYDDFGEKALTIMYDGLSPTIRIKVVDQNLSSLSSTSDAIRVDFMSEWTLNEGSGNTIFDAEGDNNGVIHGPAWTEGKIGSGLFFDGIDDYVTVDGSAELCSNSLSIETWIKMPPGYVPQDITENTGIVSKRNGTDLSYQLLIDHMEDSFSFSIGESGLSVKVSGKKTDWLPDTWYHIVGTYDGDTLKLYADGLLIGTKSNVSDIHYTDQPITIGCTESAGDYIKATLDEVRIYTYALREDTIEEHYSFPGKGRIIASYGFSEGEGEIAADTSGHGYDGILYGATWTPEGIAGQGLSFNGLDNYVDCGNIGSPSQGTVEACINFRSIPSSGNAAIVNFGNLCRLGFDLSCGNNHLRFGIYDGEWKWADSGIMPVPDTWYHLIGTYGPEGIKIYVNGALSATHCFTGGMPSYSAMLFGVGSGGSYLEGTLDQVCIYNHQANEQEVARMSSDFMLKIEAVRTRRPLNNPYKPDQAFSFFRDSFSESEDYIFEGWIIDTTHYGEVIHEWSSVLSERCMILQSSCYSEEVYSLSSLSISFNLQGVHDVKVGFNRYKSITLDDAQDGFFLSADGGQIWYKLIPDSTYHDEIGQWGCLNFNLSEQASHLGLELGRDTVLKWQNYGNSYIAHEINPDGYKIDNVTVSGKLNLPIPVIKGAMTDWNSIAIAIEPINDEVVTGYILYRQLNEVIHGGPLYIPVDAIYDPREFDIILVDPYCLPATQYTYRVTSNHQFINLPEATNDFNLALGRGLGGYPSDDFIATTRRLDTPEVLSAYKIEEITPSPVVVRWQEVEYADQYYVYTGESSKWHLEGVTTSTSYEYTYTDTKYKVKVRAFSSLYGFSDYSDTRLISLLSSPHDIAVRAQDFSSVLITFYAEEGVRYDIFRSENKNNYGTKIGQLFGENKSVDYVDSGLEIKATYYYRIRPYHNGYYGSYSLQHPVTIDNILASHLEVEFINGLSDKTQWVVKWDAVPSSRSVKYEIWAKPELGKFVGNIYSFYFGDYELLGETIDVTSATLNIPYPPAYCFFRIFAKDNYTPPPPPPPIPQTPRITKFDKVTVLVFDLTAHRYDVYWTDVEHEDGYYIYRSTSPSGPYELWDTVGRDVTKYTMANYYNLDITYYFQVKAFNSSGVSGSSASSGQPSSSSGIIPDTYSSQITVSFTSIKNAAAYYLACHPVNYSYPLMSKSDIVQCWLWYMEDDYPKELAKIQKTLKALHECPYEWTNYYQIGKDYYRGILDNIVSKWYYREQITLRGIHGNSWGYDLGIEMNQPMCLTYMMNNPYMSFVEEGCNFQIGDYGWICFVAGTQVDTAEGPKNIEDIREGDLVLSEDENSGAIGYKRVIRTFVNHAHTLVRITIGNESIQSTPRHLFWSADREGSIEGGWIKACDLKKGSKLFTSGGEWIEVTDIHIVRNPSTVYNFEVEQWHTYFVGASRILVHNDCDKEEVELIMLNLIEACRDFDEELSVFEDPLGEYPSAGFLASYSASQGFDNIDTSQDYLGVLASIVATHGGRDSAHIEAQIARMLDTWIASVPQTWEASAVDRFFTIYEGVSEDNNRENMLNSGDLNPLGHAVFDTLYEIWKWNRDHHVSFTHMVKQKYPGYWSADY